MVDAAPQIEELALPGSIDAVRGTDYEAVVDIHNAIIREYLGDAGAVLTREEFFSDLVDHAYERKRLYVIRDGSIPVGFAVLYLWVEPASRTSWHDVYVHPDHRQRGYGSALLRHIEVVAREAGKPVAQGGGMHRADVPGSRIVSPTGFGEVAEADPVAAFLTHRGWNLAQVHRYSRLSLPVNEDRLRDMLAAAASVAGSDYRLQTWAGPTPDQWLDGVTTIMGRMHTDAPSGDLEVDDEPWSTDRVRAREARRQRAGQAQLAAGVVHLPSGSLVAYSDLVLSEDRTRPAQQAVTLVLKEYRGHRLGTLVKLANIRQLQETSPETPAILTDNAEENRPMLDVNEAIGFVPISWTGAWQKSLA